MSLWSTKGDQTALVALKKKKKKKGFEQSECHSPCYIRLQENQAALNGIATKCVEYGEKVKKFSVTCSVYLILALGENLFSSEYRLNLDLPGTGDTSEQIQNSVLWVCVLNRA